MAANTRISWCDHTFNPWIGCTKVGPACDGCYAEVSTPSRAMAVLWGNHPRHRTAPSTWKQPLRWEREQAAKWDAYEEFHSPKDDPYEQGENGDGVRPASRFVFCASLADVFDNQVDPQWRRDLFDLIRATPHLTWLLLTKRPQNIVKLFIETEQPGILGTIESPGLWPRNAAIGCTVVTQAEADREIPHLLAAKAALSPALAFVSMEPLLEAVDLTRIAKPCVPGTYWIFDVLRGTAIKNIGLGEISQTSLEKLDWVIAGGETDQGAHKARPSHPDWFRSLRDQCAAAGVPFHFKQWGEFHPADQVSNDEQLAKHGDMGHALRDGRAVSFGDQWTWRVGKKAAGRLLDGREHNDMPAWPHA